MYQDRIKQIAPTYDPRHIEAFMRLEYGTLDNLSPAKFRRECGIAADCIQTGGKRQHTLNDDLVPDKKRRA